jgi:hypothetical protein|tara:strand:- start:125 stop:544 length:420 start_codon:yes stop_codon:yes gene_type:complete
MAFEYRRGPRILIELPLDSTSANITPGMAITAAGATDGYFKEVDAAAENVLGIAVNKVTSPASDGGAMVKLDVSTLSIYEVGPDAGSMAVTINQNTCDVGADAKSIDINGSSTDDILILVVDTDTNKALVRLAPIIAGV